MEFPRFPGRCDGVAALIVPGRWRGGVEPVGGTKARYGAYGLGGEGRCNFGDPVPWRCDALKIVAVVAALVAGMGIAVALSSLMRRGPVVLRMSSRAGAGVMLVCASGIFAAAVAGALDSGSTAHLSVDTASTATSTPHRAASDDLRASTTTSSADPETTTTSAPATTTSSVPTTTVKPTATTTMLVTTTATNAPPASTTTTTKPPASENISDYTLSCAPSPITLASGASAQLTCRVSTLDGYRVNVKMSCRGHLGVTCQPTPQTVSSPVAGPVEKVFTVAYDGTYPGQKVTVAIFTLADPMARKEVVVPVTATGGTTSSSTSSSTTTSTTGPPDTP